MNKIFTCIFFFLSLNAVKAQKHAALLSVKGIGGNDYDGVVPHVTPTADSGFIICFGTSSTNGNIDSLCANPAARAIFQKYNAAGTIIEWTKCYPASSHGEYLFMYPTADGGAVYGGDSSRDFAIRKDDASGNTIWSRHYGGSGDEYPRDMISTEDGGYIMFGESYSNDGDVGSHYGTLFLPDLWAIKLDSNGNKVWSRDIGGSSQDNGFSIAFGPHGGCYVFGETQSNDFDCTGFHGEIDAYVARLDSNGNIMWHRDLGGNAWDGYYGWACADGKGGLLLANGSSSSDGDVHHQIDSGVINIWALDIDSNSNIVWDNCYGGSAGTGVSAICKSTNGDIWIAGTCGRKSGQVDTAFGKSDAWILHTDGVGKFIDAKVMGTHAKDEATMICPLAGGSILAGGFYDTAAVAGEDMPANWYGGDDVFLATFSPWPEDIPQIQTRDEAMFQLYPNPANTQINIKISSTAGGNYKIRINNIVGMEVYNGATNNTVQVNVNDWPKGMYYVEVNKSGGNKGVQKLIVQ